VRISGSAVWDDPSKPPEEIAFLYHGVALDEVGIPGDAFAAVVLLPAMAAGEDVVIDAPVSPKLVAGAWDVAGVWSSWRPGWRRSRIEAPTAHACAPSRGGTAASFSGGVDSFFTAVRRKPDVLITLRAGFAGADVLSGWDFDREMLELAHVAEELGARHVVVESNAIDFGRPLIGFQHFGAVLAAMAHGIGNSIRRLYVPGTWSHRHKRPWGAHPDVDHLWSSESLEVAHDGAEFERHEKIAQMADNQLVLDWLRVCYVRPPGANNCGRCDKCLTTKLGLLLAGKLDQCPTLGPLTPRIVRRALILPPSIEDFEMLRELIDDLELKSAITRALRLSAVRRRLPPVRKWMRRATATASRR